MSLLNFVNSSQTSASELEKHKHSFMCSVKGQVLSYVDTLEIHVDRFLCSYYSWNKHMDMKYLRIFILNTIPLYTKISSAQNIIKALNKEQQSDYTMLLKYFISLQNIVELRNFLGHSYFELTPDGFVLLNVTSSAKIITLSIPNYNLNDPSISKFMFECDQSHIIVNKFSAKSWVEISNLLKEINDKLFNEIDLHLRRLGIETTDLGV